VALVAILYTYTDWDRRQGGALAENVSLTLCLEQKKKERMLKGILYIYTDWDGRAILYICRYGLGWVRD